MRAEGAAQFLFRKIQWRFHTRTGKRNLRREEQRIPALGACAHSGRGVIRGNLRQRTAEFGVKRGESGQVWPFDIFFQVGRLRIIISAIRIESTGSHKIGNKKKKGYW